MKISLIYSADYDFQIINIVLGNSDHAWEVANSMCEDGDFEDAGIEHYDVVEFSDKKEMNDWILEQVKEGRKDK